MHKTYGEYLKKIKGEIDRLVAAEVEGRLLNHENEQAIEMLLENYERVECLLAKEMAGKA